MFSRNSNQEVVGTSLGRIADQIGNFATYRLLYVLIVYRRLANEIAHSALVHLHHSTAYK